MNESASNEAKKSHLDSALNQNNHRETEKHWIPIKDTSFCLTYLPDNCVLLRFGNNCFQSPLWDTAPVCIDLCVYFYVQLGCGWTGFYLL
jgi:hypothetical protein